MAGGFEIYNIHTDLMEPLTQAGLEELQAVHRAYGRIRSLVAYYREDTKGWEPEDKLVNFLVELEQIHEGLKAGLTTQAGLTTVGAAQHEPDRPE